jgi:hypothetical protein
MTDPGFPRPRSHAGRRRIAPRLLADPTRIGCEIGRRPASALRTTATTVDPASVI